MVYAIGADVPEIHDTAFVAASADVAGSVKIGRDASVWFAAVVRADIAGVEIGEGSNVQDGAVIHVDTGVPCVVGRGVTVGHRAVLHSCKVGDGALIGMGAVVLNGAEIGEGSIVGAGALVTQGKKFPPRTLVIGSPAKAARELTAEEVASSLENSKHYVELARKAKTGYRALSAGAAEEKAR